MNLSSLSWKRTTRWLTIVLAIITGINLTTLPGRAQQAPTPATIRLSPDDLERGQYGNQQNFFFLPPGKTGEDYQSAGFFGQKLRPYLSSSSQAVQELDHYRRQKTLFLVDKALLVGSVALYGSQVFAHGDPVYFNSTQQVAAGVAVVSLLATLFINHHTNEYLKQAVDNYNNDLPGQRRGMLWHQLRPSGLGVAPTPHGQPVLALRWQL
ncbi:hypothetical protein GO988_09985 [Hymenobacter sp. HMF4947]|uniref:Uncharacterized protein n=1 Tax=Hymenobacter ginkgonis TaxID=2682976 RepID=A0A7K1TED8_9BACT|nr:hypothetical protein [Hymenobacter ginkgonis]MVN76652.1 hypothetical protein [Hymenobacter ginkgonis]